MTIFLTTTALLGLIFIVLSARVVLARQKTGISLGVGAAGHVALGDEATASPLICASRAHANFAEYVPIALLLLGGLEYAGGSRTLCLVLAAVLVVARAVHPIGMSMKTPNAPRAAGFALTVLMILVTSAALLLRVAGL